MFTVAYIFVGVLCLVFVMQYFVSCLVLQPFLMRKRQLVALLCVTVVVQWLFLTVPWVGLQCVKVVFPGHTQLLLNCCRQSFNTLAEQDGLFLHTGYGHLRFYPGMDILILPRKAIHKCLFLCICYLDRELLIDPQGEFCTLWFFKTTLYKKQNDTCWPSGSGGVTV